MQMKTFEALTIKDAVRAIKREFGSDAVIVSTKEKAVEGKPNLRKFEVTAAVAGKSKSIGAQSHDASLFSGLEQQQMMRSVQSMDVRLMQLGENLPTKTHLQYLENGLKEIKSLLIDSLQARDGSFLEGLPSYLTGLCHQLKLSGIEEPSIAQLMKYLTALPGPETDSSGKSDSLDEFYRAQAIRWLLKRITIAPKWTTDKGSVAIHALFGPPGSGKTSLVAKLAAYFSVRDKLKTVLVSYDNIRLAAAEQLRIYAKILGIPFAQMSEPQDMAKILNEHRDADVILIDTAGMSPKNARDRDELACWRNQSFPIQMHLVLSACEKPDYLEAAIKNFAPIGIQSLAFSRLDESLGCGEIYNLCHKWSLPLSYFSIGRSIPDDIERASRERVIERIFGL